MPAKPLYDVASDIIKTVVHSTRHSASSYLSTDPQFERD